VTTVKAHAQWGTQQGPALTTWTFPVVGLS
jgi:hypothetical protein